MKRFSRMLFFGLLLSCAGKKESPDFFENCSGPTLNLENSTTLTDSLNHFSFRVPNKNWKPMRFFNEDGNSLVAGNSLENMQTLSINETDYSGRWDWEKVQQSIEQKFNVVESGEILLNEHKRRYNLVFFKDEKPYTASLFVVVLDKNRKKQYTLCLTTKYGENYRDQLCEMKPLLESFAISPN